ncbi:MAG: MFS transporter [Proteobacteria bacterium]|nr:MFS transporter [Pseudomonadota bacterium]
MSTRTIEKVAKEPSSALVTVFAIATGALVANLYYAQPLIASIGQEVGIKPDLAGSVVSVTQIGYGVGLFLLVSLADLVENKRLALTLLALTVISLVGVATSESTTLFFMASFLVGLCSTSAQILVPFIAHLAPEARRGRIVGNVMAGVLTGIMLARPVALFIAADFGWRAVFWCSAVLMMGIGATLVRLMPKHQPPSGKHYFQILRSMIGLFRDMPILRRRALYQALMFTAFNMYWTAAPLMLSDQMGMSQQGIALFALAGAGGALAAPVAGRLADRGYTRMMTLGAMLGLGVACYATGWAADAHWLVALVVLTVIFDAAIQTNQITSQRIIFSAPQETRGRVNAIYMTMNFIGGAIGSVLGTMTYHAGGWSLTAATGGITGILLLAIFALKEHES